MGNLRRRRPGHRLRHPPPRASGLDPFDAAADLRRPRQRKARRRHRRHSDHRNARGNRHIAGLRSQTGRGRLRFPRRMAHRQRNAHPFGGGHLRHGGPVSRQRTGRRHQVHFEPQSGSGRFARRPRGDSRPHGLPLQRIRHGLGQLFPEFHLDVLRNPPLCRSQGGRVALSVDRLLLGLVDQLVSLRRSFHRPHLQRADGPRIRPRRHARPHARHVRVVCDSWRKRPLSADVRRQEPHWPRRDGQRRHRTLPSLRRDAYRRMAFDSGDDRGDHILRQLLRFGVLRHVDAFDRRQPQPPSCHAPDLRDAVRRYCRRHAGIRRFPGGDEGAANAVHPHSLAVLRGHGAHVLGPVETACGRARDTPQTPGRRVRPGNRHRRFGSPSGGDLRRADDPQPEGEASAYRDDGRPAQVLHPALAAGAQARIRVQGQRGAGRANGNRGDSHRRRGGSADVVRRHQRHRP